MTRRFIFQLLLYSGLAVCYGGCRTPTAPTAPPQPAIVSPSATAKPAPTATLTPRPAAATLTLLPTELPTPRPSATPSPSPIPVPDFPTYDGPPLDRNRFGVQIHLHREDLTVLFDHLAALGAGWVKSQVSWKLYQPEADRYDEERFAELDGLVAAAEEAGVQVLLSVAKAPEWSRPTAELDGPPADFTLFRAFMAHLAGRYQGRVAAYELWNEPNLQREWSGGTLDAAAVVTLIEQGAAGVREADPAALLISAAPAPTGINDGTQAIDDRRYLREMIDAGVLTAVDAVGAHPYGWANPPDSSAAAPDPAVTSHADHPSFFFADTMNDYRAILAEAGQPDVPIWATEFGWGSYDGLGSRPPAEVSFMAGVSEWQQAAYTLRAYELVAAWPAAGPLFLWNLNFGPLLGSDHVESAYSLLRPDGRPRPIYLSLTTVPWRS